MVSATDSQEVRSVWNRRALLVWEGGAREVRMGKAGELHFFFPMLAPEERGGISQGKVRAKLISPILLHFVHLMW